LDEVWVKLDRVSILFNGTVVLTAKIENMPNPRVY
jgi:hypothetical protein